MLGAAAEDLKTPCFETLFAGAEDLKTSSFETLFAEIKWEIGNTKGGYGLELGGVGGKNHQVGGSEGIRVCARAKLIRESGQVGESGECSRKFVLPPAQTFFTKWRLGRVKLSC